MGTGGPASPQEQQLPRVPEGRLPKPSSSSVARAASSTLPARRLCLRPRRRLCPGAAAVSARATTGPGREEDGEAAADGGERREGDSGHAAEMGTATGTEMWRSGSTGMQALTSHEMLWV